MRVPRTTDSFEILALIERCYRLPVAYFKEWLPHQSRPASGHEFESDVSPAERRRLAWHLPDDFNSLPFSKREEIAAIRHSLSYSQHVFSQIADEAFLRDELIPLAGQSAKAHNTVARIVREARQAAWY